MFFENDSFCININNSMNNEICTSDAVVKKLLENQELLGKDVEQANGGFLLYIKEYCPYCQKAVQTLNGLNENSKILNVLEQENINKFTKIKEITNRTTVPQIFDLRDPKNFKYIGGCDDLISYLQKNN